MNALALYLLFAGADPQPWVVRSPKPWVVERKGPVVVRGWHYVKEGEVAAPGHHWHTCWNCGRSVQHGPENNNSRAAHTCVCGALNWEKSAKPEPFCPD